jgi:hypothetical protein
LSDQAAVDAQGLAVDPASRSRQEGHDLGDVVLGAETFKGRRLRQLGDLALLLADQEELPTRKRSVAVGPGATVLTVTSRPRSSRARIGVSASTAALMAA